MQNLSINDSIGKKFGKLIILRQGGSTKHAGPLVECQCDCGKKTTTIWNRVRTGQTKSCGCLITETHTKHGQAKRGQHTALYKLWRRIKSRCYIKSASNYPRYGALGIKMLTEWKNNFSAFEQYILHTLGAQPVATTLDRIDSKKDYEPGNLRWATLREQSINRKKHKGSRITSQFKGVSHSVKYNRWRASITNNYKTIHLGSFGSEKEAAAAYNKAALVLHGPSARLNDL